jgi:NADH:ubiquinone reductase (H+-translocating)
MTSDLAAGCAPPIGQLLPTPYLARCYIIVLCLFFLSFLSTTSKNKGESPPCRQLLGYVCVEIFYRQFACMLIERTSRISMQTALTRRFTGAPASLSSRASNRFQAIRAVRNAPCRPFSLHHAQPSPISQRSARKLSAPPFRRSIHYGTGLKAAIWRYPALRFIYHSFAYFGFFIIGGGAVVAGVFLYDATTYREDPSMEDIPVSELALNPKRGGPKNLPIAEVMVDDDDSEAMQAQRDKPKLVILGTGWGSVALLKTLNPGDYHVTVVSPVNYFLFTPMLPSATVGTLSLKSLVEPVRRIVHRLRGHFLKAEAEDVDFSSKLVEVSQLDAKGQRQHFYLPYDKLVVAVGMCFFINASRKE